MPWIMLTKALEEFYPEIKKMKLIDYKVRVMDGKDGTARVRALITSRIRIKMGNSWRFRKYYRSQLDSSGR